MTMILVSTLLGSEAFEILLVALPDHFYRLAHPDQELIWKSILHAINQGETNIDHLAAIPSDLQVIRLETFG